jgi:hypothetical protein
LKKTITLFIGAGSGGIFNRAAAAIFGIPGPRGSRLASQLQSKLAEIGSSLWPVFPPA